MNEEIINENDENNNINTNNNNNNNSNNNNDSNTDSNTDSDSSGSDSDDDFFDEDDDIEFEEIIKEKVDKKELNENIEILRNDLTNQFLSEYNINRQGDKYIQDLVRRKVENILDHKKEVDELFFNENWEYPVVNKMAKHDFSTKWIVPIVLMKRKQHKKLDDDDEIIEGLGITLEKDEKSAINDFKELDSLKQELNTGKIDFELYQKRVFETLNPYLIENKLDDNVVGYSINLTSRTELVPYVEFDTDNWNVLVGTGAEHLEIKVLDDQKMVKRIDQKTMIPSDNVTIIGFLVYPKPVNDWMEFVDNTLLGKYEKMTRIDKVIISNNITITVPNHKCLTDDVLFIVDSNTYPNINGEYEQFDIIDENTIRLHSENVDSLTEKHEITNEHIEIGTLYRKYKLPLAVNQVVREGEDKYDIKLLSESKLEPSKTVSAYLFVDFQLKNQDFINVLKTIIPSKTDYINQLIDSDFDDINQFVDVLNNYSINRNLIETNENKKLIQKLKEIHDKDEEQFEKIKTSYNEYLKKISTEEVVIENSSLYKNEYMLHDEIVEIYKFNKNRIHKMPEHFRMYYLTTTFDKGLYYHIWVEKQLKEKRGKDDISDLTKKLENLKKEKNTIESKFQKLDKIKNKTCNELKISEIVDNIDQSKTGENGKRVFDKKTKTIWEYKNNEWTETDIKSKYKEIDLLCINKDLNLNEKELSNIKCLFDKEELECVQVDWLRQKKLLEKIDNNIKIIEETVLFIDDSNDQINNATDFLQIKNILTSFHLNEIITTENEEFVQKTKMQQLVSRILSIQSPELKHHLIFKIIEKDGLMIDKMIVSKREKVNILCGHWHYKWLIDNADTIEQKNQLHDFMITYFGRQIADVDDRQSEDKDEGESAYHCSICGTVLAQKELDVTTGFDGDGHLKYYGDILDTKVSDILDQESMSDNMSDNDLKNNFFKYFDMNNTSVLKRYLTLIGYSFDDIQKLIKMQMILSSIVDKIGLVKNMSEYEQKGDKARFQLETQDEFEILRDSFQSLRKIRTFSQFKKINMIQLRQKRVHPRKIQELEQQKYFEKNYKKYFELKKISYIISRLIILLQTTYPSYHVFNNSLCSYNGLGDNEILEYTVCLVQTMKFIDSLYAERLTKEEKLEQIKEEIEHSYNQYKKSPLIQRLYEIRENKTRESEIMKQSRQMLSVVDFHKPSNINIDEFDYKKISKTKNKRYIDMMKDIYTRSVYVTNAIKYYSSLRIKDANPLDDVMMIENQCCLMEPREYAGYYGTLTSIIENEEEKEEKEEKEEENEENENNKSQSGGDNTNTESDSESDSEYETDNDNDISFKSILESKKGIESKTGIDDTKTDNSNESDDTDEDKGESVENESDDTDEDKGESVENELIENESDDTTDIEENSDIIEKEITDDDIENLIENEQNNEHKILSRDSEMLETEEIKTKLKSLISESLELNKYIEDNYISGVHDRFINERKDKPYVSNQSALIVKDSFDDLRKNKFLTFCFEGDSKGELHYFPSQSQTALCSKCGWSRNKINDKIVSHDDFLLLLDNIANANKQKPIDQIKHLTNSIKDIDSNNIESLNKEELIKEFNAEEIEEKYKTIMNRLIHYLGKDRTKDRLFVEKYIDIFRSISNSKKSMLIDTIISSYFMKYWNQISTKKINNNYIKFKWDDKTKKQRDKIREIIKNNENKFTYFYQNENSVIFKRIPFMQKENKLYAQLVSSDIDYDEKVMNTYGKLYFFYNAIIEIFDNNNLVMFDNKKVKTNLIAGIPNPEMEDTPFIPKDIERYRKLVAEFMIRVLDIVDEKILTFDRIKFTNKTNISNDDMMDIRNSKDLKDSIKEKALEHFKNKGVEDISEEDLQDYEDKYMKELDDKQTYDNEESGVRGSHDDDDVGGGGDYGDVNDFDVDDD